MHNKTSLTSFLLWLCLLTVGYAETLEKKYNLSICSLIHNEAKFLKEWIEYHRLIGIDHFYLYNIESTDRYSEILKPYIRKNIVTFIQWPNLMFEDKNDIPLKMLGSQIPAYENAVKYKAVDETRWLVFVDVGEFLLPPSEAAIPDLLVKYKDEPAVGLSSEFFDASSTYAVPPRKLIIESTELANPPALPITKAIVKTIFKPEEVIGFTYPPYKIRLKEDKEPYQIPRNELRINHYSNRNLAFLNKKKYRTKTSIDSRILNEKQKRELLDFYEIEDQEKVIYRFIPEVIKRMEISP